MINQKYNELLMTIANLMMTKNIEIEALNQEIERLKKLLIKAEKKGN